jgi:hypothetical protein
MQSIQERKRQKEYHRNVIEFEKLHLELLEKPLLVLTGHFAHVTETYEIILISHLCTLSSDFCLLNVELYKKVRNLQFAHLPNTTTQFLQK